MSLNDCVPADGDPQNRHRSAPLASGGHMPVLDGIRGLAILVVVISHTALLKSTAAADRVVIGFMDAGWCGVDLFFVLSGFLITGILLDAKGSDRFFSSFYARRTLRVFPLYYLMVVVALIIVPQMSGEWAEPYRQLAEHQKWFWLHLSNLFFMQYGFTGDATDVMWSLAIEEQFYLAWPFVVWACGRKGIARLCVLLIVMAWATRIGLVLSGKPTAAYVFSLARFDGMAAGALAAIAARSAGGLLPWVRPMRWIAAGSIVGLASIAAALGAFPARAPAVQIAGHGLFVSLSVAILIIAAGSHGTTHRLLDRPILRLFGTYSYAIYLFHLPIRTMVRDLWFHPNDISAIGGSGLPGQLLFTLVVIALSLCAGIASWHLLEKHALKLKRYFPYGTRPAQDRSIPAAQLPAIVPAST